MLPIDRSSPRTLGDNYKILASYKLDGTNYAKYRSLGGIFGNLIPVGNQPDFLTETVKCQKFVIITGGFDKEFIGSLVSKRKLECNQ